MEEKEIISAGQMLAKKKKKKSVSVRIEFTLPDPRCEHCHYWQSLSSYGNFRKACVISHYTTVNSAKRYPRLNAGLFWTNRTLRSINQTSIAFR